MLNRTSVNSYFTHCRDTEDLSYFLFLFASLFTFWLLLSGFWDNSLLVVLGLISALISAYLGWGIEKRDPRLFSLKMLMRLPRYWAWLLIEIFWANIDVVKRIWLPRQHPISPNLVRLPASQKSLTGRAIYANSITLTPGTVAVEVTESDILVHALTTNASDDLKRGEMDAQVTRTEGALR